MIKITFLYLFLYASSLFGCTIDGQNSITEKQRTFNKGEVTVSVDPRIELLSVILLLSDYNEETGLLTSYDTQYKKDILDFFAASKNHECVQIFNQLDNQFTYTYPPHFILHYSKPPELELLSPFEDDFFTSDEVRETAERFIICLRRFVKETDFITFYNTSNGFYNRIVKNTLDSLGPSEKYISLMEDLFGAKKKSYNFIIAPIFHRGGFGFQTVALEKGAGIERSNDAYYIGGPRGVIDGIPSWGGRDYQSRGIIHEFAHSFINPIVEEHQESVLESKDLIKPIAHLISKVGYPYNNWVTCIQEHLVRASTLILDARISGVKIQEKLIIDQKRTGFAYVNDLISVITELDQQVPKGFTTYFPKIVAFLNDLSKSSLPDSYYELEFDGTINSILTQKDSIAFILPTGKTEENSEYASGMIKKVAGSYYYDGRKPLVLEDTVAIGMDLKDFHLVVIGTVEGNRWLKNHSDLLPFKVYPDKIVADKTYCGDDLRFACGLPNPYNKKMGMFIATSQKPPGSVGAMVMADGRTDYIILDSELHPLKQGYFKKTEDKWTF